DHSSSPCRFLFKIASHFFDSTSSAAVSAKALSLRRTSRSSSLMRRLSSLVCDGLARASSGAASDCTALAFHCCSCCGYTPFWRHQALRVASSMAAVVITASNRAAAVQTFSLVGLDNDSERQRSSVSTPTPISRATACGDALSGGSMRATARSLNACPYRANSFSLRPPGSWFYRGDNYSDAGGPGRVVGGKVQQRQREAVVVALHLHFASNGVSMGVLEPSLQSQPLAVACLRQHRVVSNRRSGNLDRRPSHRAEKSSIFEGTIARDAPVDVAIV